MQRRRTGQQQKPVEINVQVREVQPIQIRYGASYDTERGLGGIFDISNHNSLGGAREIGLRSRYDRQLHEGRIYINQPALTYLPKTTAAIYFREELNPPTELTDPFDTSRKGASIQQEKKLRDLLCPDLRLQARARPHADADRRWRHHRRGADRLAADDHADARDARRGARRIERRVPVAGVLRTRRAGSDRISRSSSTSGSTSTTSRSGRRRGSRSRTR